MTTPGTPDAPDTTETGGETGVEPDEWESRSFVHELSSGVEPSPDPVTLDADIVREVNRKLREIEEARAAAAVSGRDYLIR